MDDNTFTIEINNQKYTYSLIKALKNTDFNYNYLIYTDNKDVFASRYKFEDGKIVLENVMYNYEWDYIDKMIEGDNNE